jgi:ADP-ribose pyrophosphatase YjhB (NUDIX family)
MVITTSLTFDNEKFLIEYHDTDDFSFLPHEKCRQTYGICFYKSQLVIVLNGERQNWTPPGGTIEKNETIYEALVREIQEETNMHVIQSAAIGYQKVTSASGEIYYQLRSVCLVSPNGPFIKDPAGDVIQIKLIQPELYKAYFDWKEVGEQIMKRGILLYEQSMKRFDLRN